jgi:hypothetical protein
MSNMANSAPALAASLPIPVVQNSNINVPIEQPLLPDLNQHQS